MSTEHEHDSVALVPESVVRPFARAVLLAALTGAVALVSIPVPISPAPITLQVLFVFLAGLYLGPIWGPVSMLLYIVTGAAGAPVFAHGNAGIGVLFGNTGGFLWSYPVAAFLIGLVVHGRAGVGLRSSGPTGNEASSTGLADRISVRDPAEVSIATVVGALTVGTVVIYAMGASYGMWLLSLSPEEAIITFVAPFVIVELIKIAAAVAIVRRDLIDPT